MSKILIYGVASAVPLAQADLFVFPEHSTLNATQQASLKVLCIKSAVDGVKTLFNEFQKDTLKNIFQTWAKTSATFGEILMPYLLNEEQKENDLAAVLAYNDAIENQLPNPEDIYKAALQNDHDGLFNGIIRETLKTYKQCLLLDSVEDRVQLEEAFNVLWDCITNANGSFIVDQDTLEKIKNQFPDFDIEGIFRSISEASGKNLCEKIAIFLGDSIKKAIKQGAEEGNCCCVCMEKTCNFVKAALPYVREIGKITIAIIAAIK